MRALEEEYETDVLVSLMEKHEYRGYQIPELLEKDSFGGIEILRFAIKDMSVPQEAESERFEAFVQKVVRHLEQGKNVVVHCRGGLGRTGTLAAACRAVQAEREPEIVRAQKLQIREAAGQGDARSGSWRFELSKRAARLLGRYRWAQNAWLKRQHDLRFGSTQVGLKVYL